MKKNQTNDYNKKIYIYFIDSNLNDTVKNMSVWLNFNELKKNSSTCPGSHRLYSMMMIIKKKYLYIINCVFTAYERHNSKTKSTLWFTIVWVSKISSIFFISYVYSKTQVYWENLNKKKGPGHRICCRLNQSNRKNNALHGIYLYKNSV